MPSKPGGKAIPRAEVLRRVLNGASLKSLCSGDRATYALVCKTLQRKPMLEGALKEMAPFEAATTDVAHAERLLLCYDLMYGKGLPRTGVHGAVAREAVRKMRRWFSAQLAEAKVNPPILRDDDGFEEEAPPALPRYARVNTLRASVRDVVACLRNLGWRRVKPRARTHVPRVATFWVDPDVRGLLVFPPGTELHQHQLVVSAALVLQDKASCMAPAALAPPAGAIVLDACAAPGNKTTQLAALAKPGGVVHALERDEARARTLQRRAFFMTADPRCPVHAHELADARAAASRGGAPGGDEGGVKASGPEAAEIERIIRAAMDGTADTSSSDDDSDDDGGDGARKRQRRGELPRLAMTPRPRDFLPADVKGGSACTCPIKVVAGADFLKASGPPYDTCTHVQLDPSCSGSGIVDRPEQRAMAAAEAEEAGGAAAEGERLRALAKMQLRLLEHALALPAARVVVYSTCSVHAIENERVAVAALRSEVARARGWRLVTALPGWPCRGLAGGGCPEKVARKLVRAGPELQTNGFFIARFERRE